MGLWRNKTTDLQAGICDLAKLRVRSGVGALTDNDDKDANESKSPSFQQSLSAIFAAVATLIVVVGGIIAFIQAGRLVFRTGLFLIIIGMALALAVVALRVRQSGKLKELAHRWGLIIAVAASLVLISAGLILAVTQRPSSTNCTTPAQVSGADTSAASFTVTVNVRCLMPTDNKSYLVVQLLNEGAKGTVKHSEYYLAWAVRNAVGRQSLADHPDGCVARRYYLINVTLDQLALLQQSPRTSSGSYYGEPIDTDINQYILSNIQVNHTCNTQS